MVGYKQFWQRLSNNMPVYSPIMLALCFMLLVTYCASNYAGIISLGLSTVYTKHPSYVCTHKQVDQTPNTAKPYVKYGETQHRINPSVYTVDWICIRTGSDTESIYCVDGVYNGAVSLHISHMVLLCKL